MWINLDDAQVELLKTLLNGAAEGEERDATLFWTDATKDTRAAILKTAQSCREIAKKLDMAQARMPHDPYRAYLQTQATDEMEVDDDASVSIGADEGAFVQAWIWVTDEKAGVTDGDDTCRTCGETYDDGGDGFDGECPSCADKTDQKLNPESYE